MSIPYINLDPTEEQSSTNFESYKLVHEAFAVRSTLFDEEVVENSAHASQFGIQQHRTIRAAAQLIFDPFNSDSVLYKFYVILDSTRVATAEFGLYDQSWTPLTLVSRLPPSAAPAGKAPFPASLVPLQKEVVLACNGSDKLVLLTNWNQSLVMNIDEPSVIVDARTSPDAVDVILQSVVERDSEQEEDEIIEEQDENEKKKGIFYTNLTWIQMVYDLSSGKWTEKRRRVCKVEGEVYTATFSPCLSEMIIMAADAPVMVSDSMKEVVQPEEPKPEAEKLEADPENMADLAEDQSQKAFSTPEACGDNANINFNQQQLEDCDVSTEPQYLYWVHGESHQIRLTSNITGKRHVFSTQLNANEPIAICLRHVDDALLWNFEGSQKTPPASSQAFFPGFGYVQAGKAKKFVTCAPNLSYTTIVEGKRHAYIYWMNKPLETQLTQRSSNGQRRVHQGFFASSVIALSNDNSMGDKEPCTDRILGVYAADRALFIMTTKQLFAVVLQPVAKITVPERDPSVNPTCN